MATRSESSGTTQPAAGEAQRGLAAALHHRLPLPLEADESQQRHLATLCMKLLNFWGLTREEQAMVLDLNPNNRALLAQLEKGKRGLPSSLDTVQRASLLLAIGNALGALYPENSALIRAWPRQRDLALYNYSPLEIIERLGIDGLFRLRDMLYEEALG